MNPALPQSVPSLSAVDYDPFAGGELACVVASTEPQREIWLADQLGTDASLSFNLSVSLRLQGALDRDALAAALQADAQRDAVEARVRHTVETPFRVTHDLLFRAELLRLSERDHQLLLSAHHVACDGWSWWVIVRELGAL